jgi:hypothetical protein
MPRLRTTVVGARLLPSAKAAVERQARRRGVTVSKHIEHLILAAEAAYRPPPAPDRRNRFRILGSSAVLLGSSFRSAGVARYWPA